MNGGSPSFRVGDDAHPAADVPADLPGAGTAAAAPTAFVDPFAAYAAEEPDEPAPMEPGWRRRVALIASIVVVVLWVGALLWFGRRAVGQLDPLLLAGYIAELTTVPILVGVLWLVFLRTSRTEAARFGASARAMRAEAAALERTVAHLGRRLDDNRRALADQIAAIATLGDATEQRFATIAETIGGQIEAAGGHAHQLADAASQAQASVMMVLSSLPRAQAGIEDSARLLDRSGAAATEHAAVLDARLMALAEHGREADSVAGGAAQRLATHLRQMEETGETAGLRLEAVTAQASAEVDALLDRTAAAIDGSRQGIAAQGEAMLAMIRAHQAALDHAARDSAEALGARIDDLEAAIDRLAGRLDDQRQAGDRLVGDLAGGIGTVEEQLAALHAQGVERSQLLAASISALGGSADAMTEALRTGEAMAQRTIGTTETLLIALDSAAREIDETLPDALSRLDAKIGGSRQIVVQARPELMALVTAAESTHDAIEAIAGVIADQRRTLDQLQAGLVDTLSEGHSKADALGEMVDDTIRRANRFADEAAPRLVDSLLQVRETAAAAADKAREALADVIPEAAAEMEAAAAAALARASGDTVERQIRALSEATESAVTGTTRAVERLERHVQSIAEQTALVETRLEDVRAEQDETIRDSFSRRSSLLIESLNSASIDITRHFAPDVADSAWAAYLKGDRGVFTRRAVRIVDAGIARDIARHYDADPGFREAVNRYIHDFEAMLRDVLAQRDGSPLGVTLLSSDIGKLYVALAQAIERLR